MKLLLFFLLIPLPSLAIELVINGITYNIQEYKIENNGKRLVINHDTIPTKITTNKKCTIPIKVAAPKKYQAYRVKNKRSYANSKHKRPSVFQRLMNDLDSSSKKKSKWPHKKSYH